MSTERLKGQPDTSTASGELMAEISRAMVQLHKESYGKGPTKARTYVAGDLVVCLLEGGFHQGERTLVEHGHEEPVIQQREAVQGALRDRFVEVIEQLLERKVASFISGMDTTTETSAELFVLEPDTGDGSDEPGEQGRSASRLLRGEQASSRAR